MRISAGTQRRSAEMAPLVQVSTSVVASPRPRALVTVLETASRGHSPSNCTKEELLPHSPWRSSRPASLMLLFSALWQMFNILRQGFQIPNRAFYPVDHGARRNGCAGELIKLPAVLLDRPGCIPIRGNMLTGKTGDPIGYTQLYFIPEARR